MDILKIRKTIKHASRASSSPGGKSEDPTNKS
jgi:hypothetical protein